MIARPPPVDVAVEAVLQDWRRKAADILLAASAVVYLPGIALFVAGHGPPTAWSVRVLAVVVYVGLVGAAVRRRLDYRVRAWVGVASAYTLAVAIHAAVPDGPFARAIPVGMPVLALVLLGARAGWTLAIVSALILLFAPLLQFFPSITRVVAAEPFQDPVPVGVATVQSLGLIGLMATLMVVLQRFHTFLMQALKDQRQATSDLEIESAERAAAHRSMEREMRERQRLEREIARTGDEERQRLGQEVHDGVCQELTSALLRCRALERRVEQGGAAGSEDICALAGLLEEALDEAHAVARGLWPLESRPDALAPALRMLARRTKEGTGVPCEFRVTGDVQVPAPEVAQHLYRIAQEALSNAVRHAHAARIVVELCGCDSELILQVQDDGIGLPDDLPTGGMGLRTMAYRARILGAEFAAERIPQGGTCIVCRVPRAAASHTDDLLAEPVREEAHVS